MVHDGENAHLKIVEKVRIKTRDTPIIRNKRT